MIDFLARRTWGRGADAPELGHVPAAGAAALRNWAMSQEKGTIRTGTCIHSIAKVFNPKKRTGFNTFQPSKNDPAANNRQNTAYNFS